MLPPHRHPHPARVLLAVRLAVAPTVEKACSRVKGGTVHMREIVWDEITRIMRVKITWDESEKSHGMKVRITCDVIENHLRCE